MALETGSFISDLNSSNPQSSDSVSQADDHIRLIKATIKATFPNVTGAVTKTQAQINDLLEKSGGTMTGTLVLAGAPTQNLHAATKAYADSLLSGGGIIPSGGIIMWSGAINAIPNGWALCNGSNGTPDLRDRFVVGAGSSYSVGGTGGSKDAIVVAHSHTATSTSSVTDPGHDHTVPAGSSTGAGTKYIIGTGNANAVATSTATTGISVSTSTTVASTGSSGTNANLPPYYALAYIMKI